MSYIIKYFYHRSPALFIVMLLWAASVPIGCRQTEAPKGPAPAAEVVTVTVTPRTLPAEYAFIARIQSSHQVQIVARVSGFLEKIGYHEGRRVQQGQVLFQIDPKPFQAAVDAARAEVRIRESQLWIARANLKRIKPLAGQDAATKADLDNAVGAEKSATAALQLAKANLYKAQLDLGYTTITAPTSGLAGEAGRRTGSYITAGTQLTYVAQLDPAWVNFSISQNQQAAALKEVADGRLLPPEGNRYTVELEMGDGSRYPHTGVVNYSEPVFHSETGTFLVRAEIPNPDGELRPGMFVTAYLTGATRPNTLAVPQKAVQQTANGHVIYIADSRGLVDVRPVVLGEWAGRDWIVTQGLKAGEQVIVDGFMQLAPGMPVKAVPSGPAPAVAPDTGR